MQHKLIMTWDITEGKEQEYFDFLVHTFVPRMNQLGFELTDAWATIYGDCPQVLVTAILPDELEATIRYAKDNFGIKEVSTETNPNHLDPLHLDRLKGLVDRMSVGVQSFDDPLLKAMKRCNRVRKFYQKNVNVKCS